MQLKLTRSQREGGVVSRAVIFCLDARVQLTPEEQASVTRYKLGNEVIYNSGASERHLAAYDDHLKQGGVGGTVRALGSLALVALNLNVTINSLQRGQHVECKSLNELLAAEEALMEACKRLRMFLDTASTFDGREVLLAFDGPEPTVLQTSSPPMLVAPQDQGTSSSPSPFALSSETEAVSEGIAMAHGAATTDAYAAFWNSPGDVLIDKLQSLFRGASIELRMLLAALGLLLLIVLAVAIF